MRASPGRELDGDALRTLWLAAAAFMVAGGAIVVDHQHHGADNVFLIIGAHVIGMFGLIVVVGDLVDRIGRTPSLAGGLALMALSVSSLLWVSSVAAPALWILRAGARWGTASEAT